MVHACGESAAFGISRCARGPQTSPAGSAGFLLHLLERRRYSARFRPCPFGGNVARLALVAAMLRRPRGAVLQPGRAPASRLSLLLLVPVAADPGLGRLH